MLSDASQFVDVIKKAAVEAVEATHPMNLVFGRVVAVSPLSVRLDQQRTIPARFLLRLSGPALEAGNYVALLRMQGGQKYLILGAVT